MRNICWQFYDELKHGIEAKKWGGRYMNNLIGIIGGADGPTAVFVAGNYSDLILLVVIIVLVLALAIFWFKRKK